MRDVRLAGSRGGRCAVLALALVAAVALCAAPSAEARFVKAPKWLKGPYRKYMLSLDGTVSSNGTENDWTPHPADGQSVCDQPVRHYEASGSLETHTQVELLFGRYKPPRQRAHTAFVYRRHRNSIAALEITSLSMYAVAGCPPSSPYWEPVSDHCTMTGTTQPFDLGFEDGPRVRGAQVYQGSLMVSYDTNDPKCENDSAGGIPDLRHFGIAAPATGEIRFDERGVRARKTFRGHVVPALWTGNPAQPGQGTDPQNDPDPQRDWTFDGSTSFSLTLAPVR